MIISMSGLIGSGKDTCANYYKKYHAFESLSFATALKKCVSALFGWPIELLQGDTIESRLWREKIDIWWSNRLGISDLTPRWVLQHFGTDIMRHYFHDDIWVATVEKQIMDCPVDYVVTDCRFPNEFSMLSQYGAIFLEVSRGPKPIWYDIAKKENIESDYGLMKLNYPEIHESEWRWIGMPMTYQIDNNNSYQDLYDSLEGIFKNHLLTHF